MSNSKYDLGNNISGGYLSPAVPALSFLKDKAQNGYQLFCRKFMTAGRAFASASHKIFSPDEAHRCAV